MEALLALERVTHTYDAAPVLKSLSFELEEGMIGCLLGPSGCGKTTALRAIAGFERIHAGRIRIERQVVAAADVWVPPEQRRVGMVFQDYALFPHLTVADNIAFGIRVKATHQRQTRIEELLDLVGLTGAEKRYPHELSGGQQQRVALARALAPNPRLLLLDEPFSNLDVALRERLSVEVREVLRRQGITAILVTHNQNEAFAMADRIGIMADGALLQWDTAYNLYHRPESPTVADFVGEGALIQGAVEEGGRVHTGLGVLEGRFTFPCSDGCPARVLIRPEDVVHDDRSLFKAKIVEKRFRGPSILYTLELASGEQVLSLVPSHHDHAVGDRIGIEARVEDIVLYEITDTGIPDGLLGSAPPAPEDWSPSLP